MRTQDFINELKPRAQRLGLVDPATGYVDPVELTMYIGVAARYLANRYQLQMFLVMNRALFHTQNGVESYTLPDNYGFVAPRETRYSGITITTSGEGTTQNLFYYEPARFHALRDTSQTGKPAFFTVTQNLMSLSPIPDTIYTIEAIERPEQDGTDIPLVYAAALEAETLYKMAADMGKIIPSLVEERTTLTRTLVNNEQRLRQAFYTSRERVGFGRHRRYGV